MRPRFAQRSAPTCHVLGREPDLRCRRTHALESPVRSPRRPDEPLLSQERQVMVALPAKRGGQPGRGRSPGALGVGPEPAPAGESLLGPYADQTTRERRGPRRRSTAGALPLVDRAESARVRAHQIPSIAVCGVGLAPPAGDQRSVELLKDAGRGSATAAISRRRPYPQPAVVRPGSWASWARSRDAVRSSWDAAQPSGNRPR
jgi:hypothetical protein